MKTIKYFLITMSILLSGFIVNGQSAFTIEASQLYTTFKFEDTQGNQIDNEYKGIFTGAYGVGYKYTTDFGLIIKTGIGMRNAGAELVFDEMNYSWKLQYADVKLGLGYIYKRDRISPYFTASAYYAYLLRGSQVLNNEHFNITESGLLNRTDYGVILAPGLEIRLSDDISTRVEFNYLMGLANIETDEGQNTTNFAYGLTLGLSFAITSKKSKPQID